jgi:hypothetical protein
MTKIKKNWRGSGARESPRAAAPKSTPSKALWSNSGELDSGVISLANKSSVVTCLVALAERGFGHVAPNKMIALRTRIGSTQRSDVMRKHLKGLLARTCHGENANILSSPQRMGFRQAFNILSIVKQPLALCLHEPRIILA